MELAHIDLSYCYKLKKPPISTGKLKKVKTLLLDEYQVDMWDMKSSNISSINSQRSSSAIMGAIPNDFKFFLPSLPRLLTSLSLANNNLSDSSFPVDFSCLSVLKELCLDDNPFVSMPSCVRTLPRLEKLTMDFCKMLISVELPPPTLRVLSIDSGSLQHSSLRRITFDPKMRSLEWLIVDWKIRSYEIEGIIKIQPMAGVEEKLLHILGWKNLEFIKGKRFKAYECRRRLIECETQVSLTNCLQLCGLYLFIIYIFIWSCYFWNQCYFDKEL